MNASDFLPADFNVASWFVDRPVAEGRGAAPAFHCEGRVLSYADVRELADRTGNALRELGVEMEQRVVMICLDAPEFLGAFWGAIKIGAVPVPVNTLLRAADYRYVLDDSRARVAVVSSALLAEAAPALEGAPAPPARAGRGRARPGATSRSRTGSPGRPGPSRPRPPLATTSRSGCTPRARRAAPRGPSTSTTTWSSPPRPTRSRCSASGRPTRCTPPPSSSSPTASATRATSR